MNFRRWITALAVLALFAGLASAQVTNSNAGAGPFTCTASVSVPPVLRAEGLTETVGDIVLACSGGAVVAPGTSLALNTANITVSFGTNVTSRLLSPTLGVTSSTMAGNTNEALLLIDEPNSSEPGPVPGFGPNAGQVLCGSGGLPFSTVGAGPGGCPEFVELSAAVNVMTNAAVASPVYPTNVGANVFSGVWGGSSAPNQVTFYGIPIMPPTTAGAERVFRMTNIRINANALAGGPLAGTTQVYAYISISGPTSVPVNNSTLVAGSVQSGLTTSMRNASDGSTAPPPYTFPQCTSTPSTLPGTALAFLRYSSNFGTAFKLRTGTGSSVPTNQNVPGTIYNSESDFIPYNGTPLIYGLASSNQAGLADYGTRLKAVFNNVPTGVRIFVTTTNATNATTAATLATATTPYAQLVISETAGDGSGVPAIPAAGLVGGTTLNYAEIIPVNGTAMAVWEILGTNPSTLENFDFGVYILYSASPATNTPPPGATTLNMSYAPTATQGAFTASAGALASGVLPVPRFADTSTAATTFTIAQCTTSLLFPFVTNQVGFDTGIAIVNTTSDPFGTKPQAGTCTLSFYGQNAPASFVTPSIPSGVGVAPAGNWAFQASNIAPNFEGYMIAVCNFQLAHGLGIITDLGAQKLAYGYEALVLPTGTGSRNGQNPEQLEN